ncbi:N2,N2-dimethylguanosine tRNA methyltransferase [Neocallimastix lanati (nom. inval.)]|nr:N2,N2-dimethylguanosine tRNA methyltransferase [Neocallimastix sp. JGI-2020a]
MGEEFNIDDYNTITEGAATILFPKANDVFYNPIQHFNRDMSTAAIKTWQKQFLKEKKQKMNRKNNNQNNNNEATPEQKNEKLGITILEALAASGLRSIRYAKEIGNVKKILSNDMSEEAVDSIKRNVKYNKVEDIVIPNKGDAMMVMYENRDLFKRFDVIDLDPYGSASPFLDGAVQSVSDGGLLCITCTDMAVLCSSGQTEACWAKYGGVPIPNSPYCHEMALRILLHAVQSSAARYRRTIVPLLSCSIDFYIRIFVKVYTSASKVKQAASKSSIVYHCTKCKSFAINPFGRCLKNGTSTVYKVNVGPNVDSKCNICGSKYHIGGPFYSDPIHDPEFVKEMLEHVKESEDKYKTHKRMLGMLTVISEELPIPFFYTSSTLASTLRCNVPPLVTLCSAILNKGYKVSLSHTNCMAIKTDASPETIWDIMRCWVKKNPLTKKHDDSEIVAKILKIEPSFEADFSIHKDANPTSRKIKLVRFQANPTKNWGPKSRPKKRKESNSNKTNKAQKVQKTKI